MLRKTVFLTALALMFCLSLTGSVMADQQQMIKDMAAIDRVFIPCLSLTNKNAVGPSTKAIKALSGMWSQFNAKYAKAMPQDDEWPSDLNMVSDAIKEAVNQITVKKDSDAAHHALEEVRFAFLQMRTRNKIPYYMDYLNQYHEVMEPLIHNLDKEKAKAWGDKERKEIAGNTAIARAAWQKAAQAPVDDELFELTPGKVKKLKAAYAQGNRNFADLEAALAKGDNMAVFACLKKVKPAYRDAFKLFGDFKRFKK